MPWPMVHFAIASKVSLSKPSPCFLLGSIAPDALHMRANVTRKDKAFTHLVSEDKFPTIETMGTACLNYLDKKDEPAWKEYILGYFAHIYADWRWTDTVYAQFESNYQGEKDEIRKVYNREVSQVEFDLLRSGSWVDRIFYNLQRSKSFAIEPLVTETEVSQYRDLKIDWLQDGVNEPRIKPVYFPADIVNSFITQTSNEFSAWMKEWGIKVPGENGCSQYD